jgi:pilus assembly protein Flp/PilA
MNFLAQKMQRFLVAEEGPSAVEYAIMVALIVTVCLTAISAVSTMESKAFTTVANSVDVPTGS